MDRFVNIKHSLLLAAGKDPDIKAIVIIGSSTRAAAAADEYSDLDVVIVTDHTEKWLYGDYPNQLGEVKISFVEPTLGGGKERRILYDGSLDVDMIIFTPTQFETAVKEGVAGWVMNRGYVVMYDSMGYTKLLEQYVSHEVVYAVLPEPEFMNMVQDFFFHTVWAAKKILEDLKQCFAHYNKEDLVAALFATEALFDRLADQTAKMNGYQYPAEAEKYAKLLLHAYFVGRD